jgi:hypothetical protein
MIQFQFLFALESEFVRRNEEVGAKKRAFGYNTFSVESNEKIKMSCLFWVQYRLENKFG